MGPVCQWTSTNFQWVSGHTFGWLNVCSNFLREAARLANRDCRTITNQYFHTSVLLHVVSEAYVVQAKREATKVQTVLTPWTRMELGEAWIRSLHWRSPSPGHHAQIRPLNHRVAQIPSVISMQPLALIHLIIIMIELFSVSYCLIVSK